MTQRARRRTTLKGEISLVIGMNLPTNAIFSFHHRHIYALLSEHKGRDKPREPSSHHHNFVAVRREDNTLRGFDTMLRVGSNVL